MHSGSVLIYFKEEQIDDERPIPSIRAELDVLRNSGSTWLNNALMIGRIDDSDDDWTLPTSPESSMLSQQHSHHNYQPAQRRMLGPTSPGGRSPPPFDIDQAYDGISTRAASRLDQISDVARLQRSASPPPFRQGRQHNPTHEIWFTAPSHIRTAQGQRLHHVAIRNFLAMLHGKPIVGADLYDMLCALQPEIEVMYDLDSESQSRMTPRERSVHMITTYLIQHGIDDVRTSIKSAMCLLAWSEQDNVRWRQGYLENFVHLAGVMIPALEDVPEFRRLSTVTRRNLGIAAKTLTLRVMEAEEKLATFDFSDLWEDTSKVADRPVYQSYRAFRQFLVHHYTRNYGNWPPATNKTWLNRKIVSALQEDFGSLYEYLVNRDVIWNPREERATRKWEMAHRKNASFKADLPELGITDMLVAYDAKFAYTHIPHPYPLLPRDVPKSTKEKEKKSLFSSLKKDKSTNVTKDAKAHLQLSILFSDATNIEKLDANFNGTSTADFPIDSRGKDANRATGSTLIDKFEQFEMTTDLKNTTPREARLGRWVLLYGILQVLSTLSVDVRALKHTEGVRYFLCTDLKRLPEWVTNKQTEYLEASQHHSWCWQRAWDPAPTQTAPVELEATSSHDHTRSDFQLDSETRAPGVREDPEEELEREREPPPPPRLGGRNDPDGATLLQNDIHRISEKINSLSLSHTAHQTFTQDFSLRRENEKVIQSDFHDRKPRLDSLHPPTPNPPQPSPASLHRDRNHLQRQQMNESYTRMLESHDFNFAATTANTARHLEPTRSHVASMNTDLGGYPFSSEDMSWPVPPGYSENANHRESGVGYSTGNWNGVHGGGGGGGTFLDVRTPRRELGDLTGGDTDRDRRSPRRVHERGGW
jgi:hypothetical protein